MAISSEAKSKTLDPSRVWFITGCSAGFGRALAETALSCGYRAVITARDPSRLEKLEREYRDRALVLALDVTNGGQVVEAVSRTLDAFGRIDVLVNNAGFGMGGAIEEVSDAEARRLFDTNLFGLLTVTRVVLPSMRARRSGHVINMSSMGGIGASAGFGIYNASKFAVEAISESLALELAPLGIHITMVEPGYFRTEFLSGSIAFATSIIEDYAATSGRVRVQAPANAGKQPGDPARAARAIIDIAEMAQPPLRLPLGRDALVRIRGKLEAVARDVDRWEQVAASTDFD